MYKDKPLLTYNAQIKNSFQLQASTSCLIQINSIKELEWVKTHYPQKKLILGEDNNVILPEKLDYPVLHISIREKLLLDETTDAWIVQAGAGENWHNFVLWSMTNGYFGLENLAFIPGSVGASPIQNIGAYGLELSDRFHHLNWFDLSTGDTGTTTKHEAAFSYRKSIFKTKEWSQRVITSVCFQLPKIWKPILNYKDLAFLHDNKQCTPKLIFETICKIRQQKIPDPTHLGNVGSFFINPSISSAEAQRLQLSYPDLPLWKESDNKFKISAAWLVEKSGWKGKSIGGACMYAQHALIMINKNQASYKDVINLSKEIIKAVKNRFDVMLMPEPLIINP